ncbi:MAG: type II toxin-antitoxin system HicA family toxin [Candidatus Diapherotrites archaeon]|nr:type II toxin-antitoxin system HicA family toxin [Candidatus Diapherotrites archaeon]
MRLPILSGKEVIKFLSRKGFEIVGRKGSHIRLKREINGKVLVTVVPLHKKIDVGTLLAILKQCEIERQELKKL